MREKILVIRFSSFGDIIQCLSVVEPLYERFFEGEISFATKSEFADLVGLHPHIKRVFAFDKNLGLLGLLKFALKLRKEKFTHIYDAHKNLRSFFLRMLLKRPFGCSMIVRPKSRLKRFLLFKWGINKFPWPFRGMKSYLKPLLKWGVDPQLKDVWGWKFSKEICSKTDPYKEKIVLAPSAAWEMKRWPLSHFKKLIELLPEKNFLLIGGPGDTFLDEITRVAPNRVENLAGKLSLVESCNLVMKSALLVSADTGIMHVADLFKVPTIALIGPTAFGFPTGNNTHILEIDLPCRPCSKDGRGKCSQNVYQRCMVELTPEKVATEIKRMLS